MKVAVATGAGRVGLAYVSWLEEAFVRVGLAERILPCAALWCGSAVSNNTSRTIHGKNSAKAISGLELLILHELWLRLKLENFNESTKESGKVPDGDIFTVTSLENNFVALLS